MTSVFEAARSATSATPTGFGDRLEALIKELRASGQSELAGHESIDRREAQLIAET